jgi:hypothetical protein
MAQDWLSTSSYGFLCLKNHPKNSLMTNWDLIVTSANKEYLADRKMKDIVNLIVSGYTKHWRTAIDVKPKRADVWVFTLNHMIRQKVLPLKNEVLLNQLEELAERLEIPVRYENITTEDSSGTGGLCRIKGEYVLMIHSRLAVKEKVQVIITALKKFDLSEIYIKPALRELLEKCEESQVWTPTQALETDSAASCRVWYPPLRGIIQLANSNALRFSKLKIVCFDKQFCERAYPVYRDL